MLLSYIFFLFQVQAMSKEKPKVQEYVLMQYLNPYDNTIVMNPYACTYMYIYNTLLLSMKNA